MKSKVMTNNDEKLLKCSQFLLLYYILNTKRNIAITDIIAVTCLLGVCKIATKLGISLNVSTAVLAVGLLAKKTISNFFFESNDSQEVPSDNNSTQQMSPP